MKKRWFLRNKHVAGSPQFGGWTEIKDIELYHALKAGAEQMARGFRESPMMVAAEMLEEKETEMSMMQKGRVAAEEVEEKLYGDRGLDKIEEEQRVEFAPGQGVKISDGKPQYELVPPRPLLEIVKVFTWGAAQPEYAPRNWEKGVPYCKYFGAMMRHAWVWMTGETFDQKSGLHHLAHAAFYMLALMEFDFYPAQYSRFDDRPLKGQPQAAGMIPPGTSYRYGS
jgi:hypothetical protein